jgi:hypothetical protein
MIEEVSENIESGIWCSPLWFRDMMRLWPAASGAGASILMAIEATS